MNPTLLLAIPMLPLLAAIIAGFFGKAIGRAGAHSVTIAGVFVSAVLSIYVLKQVYFDGVPTYNAPVYTWLVSDGITFQVGFLIDPDVWGRGYASEALAAYLDRRRAIGNPDTLRADVDPRNQASLALLTRHGFTETHRANGTWQIGDELCDSVYLELKL